MADKNDIKQRVFRFIEGRRDEIVRTLSELVRIPSLTGQEGEAQKYMHRLYSDLGLKVTSRDADLDKISRHKAYVKSVFDYSGRPNTVGVLEGEPSAKSLILNGHIDAVSPEPVRDPATGHEG